MMKAGNAFHRRSAGDIWFSVFNYTVLGILFFIVAYPLYFVVIASFSDPTAVAMGNVKFLPVKPTLVGYQEILKNNEIWLGYKNSLFYTVVGTSLNIFLTMTAAYVLTRSDMPGRNLFMFLFTFTMFFSGGLIPTYLTAKDLNLLNTRWILLLLGAVNIQNLIIARTSIQSNIPKELYEAATIDGCSDFGYFFKMVLPLSKAIIAVLVIYYAVGHWNQYFNALVYVTKDELRPLQVFLSEILLASQSTMDEFAQDNASHAMMVAESMKYGVIIVASIPVLIIYPFVQKYFMKGVMIGSLKG